MQDSWLKIYRKITKSELWGGEPFSRGQAWILFVTFCRFFENINLALTSADPVAVAGVVFRTALIVTSSIDPRSRRLQLQRHISHYTTKASALWHRASPRAGPCCPARGAGPAGSP